MTKMRWNPPRLAPLLAALSALIAACGGAGSDPSITQPKDSTVIVFSFLSVTPTEAVMCLVDPGNTVVLNATPRDQNGQAIANLGTPSFTSSDAGAATVSGNGLVRAIAAGTAEVTVSLTSAGTTRTALASITVASAVVGEAIGSVLGNHQLPHFGAITAAQLAAGNALNLNIQGQAFHSHTLNLEATQVRLISAGCRISQVSSTDPHSDGSGAHNHAVTFN